jgi:hypothetical protein
VDAVSPELALVDPDLAVAARRALPVPGDCLAPSVFVPRPVAAEDRRSRRPSFVAALMALLTASLIGMPDLAHVFQHVRGL